MSTHLITKKLGLMTQRSGRRNRVYRHHIRLEPLEARRMLSGMESNWVMGMGANDVLAAAGADGSVYSVRLDADTETYYLSKYSAAGELDLSMDNVPLLTGNGLNNLYVHHDDSDNIYIYAGGTFSGSIDFAGTPLVSQGDTDVFIARFDSAGVYEWSQRFGGPDADSLVAFDVDGTGDVIAAGSYSGTATFSHSSTEITELSSTLSNATATFVFKLDDGLSGSPDWARQLQESGSFGLRDLDASDTHVFLLGSAERCRLNGATYNEDAVVKMDMDDATGNSIVWVHEYTQGEGSTYPRALVQHENMDHEKLVYVTGYFTGTVDFGEGVGTLTTTDKAWAGGEDSFVLEIIDRGANAENQWVRQFRSSFAVWAEDIGLLGVHNPEGPTLVVSGRFYSTTHFDYDHETSTAGALEPLTSRGNAAFIDPIDPDTYLAEMKLDGSVQRARQLGGVERDFDDQLAIHPEVDAINFLFHSHNEITHTPGGSLDNRPYYANSGETSTRVLTHINRQAPQLEIVHVFDTAKDEVASAVEQGRLTFAANVDGARTTLLPVTWKVDGNDPDDIDGDPNDAKLTLLASSLLLGGHTIQAEVTDPVTEITAEYTYTFDVTPNAPTDLIVTPGKRAVTVEWTDNSGASDSTHEDGFEVNRRQLPEIFYLWDLIGSTGSDTTLFEDTTVKNRTDYEYVVRSVVELPDGRIIRSPAVEVASTLDEPSTNVPPVALPDSYQTVEDTSFTETDPGVLTNDDDPDSDPLTAELESEALYGTVTLSQYGGFTYVPETNNFHGTDSFTYRAFDGSAYSDPATVTIMVSSVPDGPPVADAGGDYQVFEGQSIVLDASGTTDPDLPYESLTYEWDFDEDGVYDTLGVTPLFDATGLPAGSAVTVGLRVTDSDGFTDHDTALVSVMSAPTIFTFVSEDVPQEIRDPHPRRGPRPTTSELPIESTGVLVGTIEVDVLIGHQSMTDLTATITNPNAVAEPLEYVSGTWLVANPSAFAEEPLDGTWTLTISDNVKNGITGTLESWSLIITPWAAAAADGSGGSPQALSTVDAVPEILLDLGIQTSHRSDAEDLFVGSVMPDHPEVRPILPVPQISKVRAVDEFMTYCCQEREESTRSDRWIEKLPWELWEDMQHMMN